MVATTVSNFIKQSRPVRYFICFALAIAMNTYVGLENTKKLSEHTKKTIAALSILDEKIKALEQKLGAVEKDNSR